ncbi:helix-turn-helix domain-containing protein [Streptomyces sp. NPDC018031]|uniref:helix-turn-helix domain-containing protein n=1 Tax=Streptomyces sp. NPDC018031 TaxID=3365033 RepID=UPI00379AA30C
MPAPTLRDLIAAQPAENFHLLAGHAGLDAPVTGVRVADIADPGPAVAHLTCTDLPPRTGLSATHLVDVALHRHHATGASGLLLCQLPADHLAQASRRLADRRRLPLLVAPLHTSAQAATELLLWIHGPQVQRARQLTGIARALRTTSHSLTHITSTLARHLNARTAALAADGATIAGDDLGSDLLPHLHTPAPITGTAGDRAFAAHPLRGENGAPDLWLAATNSHGGPQWAERALAGLALAEAYASVWLATSVMRAERNARFRTTLLSEILAAGDAVPANTAAIAARAGWRLTGWHTAIHLLRLIHNAPPATTADDLTRALAQSDLALGPLVEQSDGWAAWITSDHPPRPGDGATVVGNLAQALHTYHARISATPVVAGIGRPANGPAGLATSMAEARHAALATALADIPGRVQHADQLGITQILMATCNSPAMRETAATLLTPLLDDPAGPDLLRTIETYLTSGCSTADTARRLNLHRNTVTQRLARACAILGITLDTADERLAIQLACRAHRLPHATGHHHRKAPDR